MGKRKLSATDVILLRKLHQKLFDLDFSKWMEYFIDTGFKVPEYRSGDLLGNEIPEDSPIELDVRIEYFLDGKSLGIFPGITMSTVMDRRSIAEENEIGEYDRCICRTYPGGYGTDFRRVEGMFMDDAGNFWIRSYVKGKKKKK